MLFTDTMTVYNHYMDGTGDHWQRTVVKGIQWRHSKNSTKLSSGVTTSENVESITVDMSRDYGNLPYTYPMQFAEDTEGHWTLNSEGLDVVVLGECMDEVTDERQLKNLRKTNQYVATVREVVDNSNRPYLKNLKVVAK